MSATLIVERLSKSYESSVVLNEIDLTIEPGEVIGLLGRNGAGKTTFAHLVVGLLRPDSGYVSVQGANPSTEPQRARSRTGYVSQELAIYPTLTVRQNLQFFAELCGLHGRSLRRECDEVADAVRLTESMMKRVQLLSGGEKRRLHTAVALLGKPPLLMLDEPTAGVDAQCRADILTLVRTLADKGAAICYSTHYMAEVETLDASVAILEAGSIIARGPVKDVVRQHARPAVEIEFLGQVPAIELNLNYEIDRDILRVYTERPSVELPALMQALGNACSYIKHIELLEPSLESVYLSLTGRRYRRRNGELSGEVTQ